MENPGKYQAQQMELAGLAESWVDSRAAKGVDVYHTGSGRVREEWLSRCREERALTGELMKQIVDLPNLIAAMRQVVRNGGSAGVDGMKVRELQSWFSKNYKGLITELQNGTYRPEVVKGVEIPKPNGGVRQLGIPTVKDRLVHQAIQQVLNNHYDATFSRHSYGFRKGRSAHDCIRQAGAYVKAGHTYIVDIDLAKFFDEVNHDRLQWLLRTRIGDKSVLKLISRILKSGVMLGGMVNQRIKGTPQGSPLSPLLSNVVLDELDKELERRGHRFVRYADDMIIMVKTEQAAERVKQSISRYIEDKLKLRVNRDKSGIRRYYELHFLGFRLLRNGAAALSQKSEDRLKKKLKLLTSRRRGISLKQLIKELNPVLRGWLNYFGIARIKDKMRIMMTWLRRRIRCFRLKQCKRAIGMVRFLIKQGVPKWRAWLLALSSKGWYHKANSPQSHEAMNNAWFSKIGLYDLFSNYCLKLKETAQYDQRTLGGVRGR